MPTVNITAETGESTWGRIDVLQVSNLDPADSDTNIPPGYAITFDLRNSSTPHIFNFEDSVDPFYHCTYAEGFTQAIWNTGSGDEWDLYTDDDNKVLRCQGQGTALLQDEDYISGPTVAGNTDMVCRVRWFTGTAAGLLSRTRWDTYAAGTSGIVGTGLEIDSGGLRYLRYEATGQRNVRATAAFTPTDGEWYWIRLQTYGYYQTYGRAKYWQGYREDEPDTWNISTWQYNYHATNTPTWNGCGVRCHSGDAYFDHFECWTVPHDDYLSQLAVEVDGISHTLANGGLVIRPDSETKTLNSTDTRWHMNNAWRVGVRWDRISQPLVGTVDVDILWNGASISATDFDVQNIPGAWPTYDPSSDNPSGDPNRMGTFESVDGFVLPVGAFSFFRTIFNLSFGYQDAAYHIAQIAWPTNHEDFRWNLYTPYYTPVDGRYYVAHPVYRDHPSSVIPAQPVEQVIPSDVVPQGALPSLFPANVIPQAYIRKEFKASVLPSFQLWWEGNSSAVVGQSVIDELDASTLVYQARVGSTIHMRVLSETTHAKLQALGVSFATVIEVSHEIGEYDWGTFTINPPWYDPNWLSRVKITIDKDEVDTDLTDFDVLITEANLPAHFWSNVRSDGADIVFTDSTGKVAGKLKRDLYHWDYAGNKMCCRVQTDVSASTDTEIYLYYNYSSGSETNDTDTYESNSVFWPIVETPPAAQQDRTAGNHDGIAIGSPAAGTREAGLLGYAWNPDGSDDVYWTSTATGYTLSNVTLSAWVNIPSSSPDDGFPVFYGRDQYGNYHRFQLGVFSGYPRAEGWAGGSQATAADSTVRSGWTKIDGVFTPGTPEIKLYVNGGYITNNTSSISYGPTDAHFAIGAANWPAGAGGWQYHYADPIDEPRAFHRALGPNEISTRYNNESSPSTFYSVDAPESPP